MKIVLQKLRDGKALAILPDVRMPVKSISVPFLGGEANLGKGMALFARHADVPIFPFIMTRQGWARHKIDAFAPIRPDKNLSKEEDIKRMTIAVIKIIDEAIHRAPEQWFWFNKRWVLDPL